MNNSPTIWYQQPAEFWEEALPLGNGRLGAMVYGGIGHEIISLNEDTLWSGYPCGASDQDKSGHFRTAREATLAGEYDRAQEEIEANLLGRFTESYMPLCDLKIAFEQDGSIKDYRSALDLSKGLYSCAYKAGDATYFREALVSHSDQMFCYTVRSAQQGRVSFSLRYDCQLKHRVILGEDHLLLQGLCPTHVVPSYIQSEAPVWYSDKDHEKGMRFCAAVSIESKGGQVGYHEDCITVTGADEATIRFVARSSFNGYDKHPYLDGRDEVAACQADMQRVSGISYEESKLRHIADFSSLFNRVQLDLGLDQFAHLNTAQRLEADRHLEDTGLMCLLFHYGRYLMISSSRPGTQASNLQGIWNKDVRPIWSSNYTININTQMNYWLAEPGNLSELHQPLFHLIGELAVSGMSTAKNLYGADGSVSHHNTDLWRLSSPVGGGQKGFAGCAFFPASLAWLSAHLMIHYRYTEDKAFLLETALPMFRQAVRFLLDTMATDDHGRRFVSPATSPENVFLHKGKVVKVAREASINNVLAREAIQNYLSALRITEVTEPMQHEAEEALRNIPVYQIGSLGQLLEWDVEHEEPEPNHRHVSHLYGLYPGDEITLENTPELAKACKRSLELRGKDGTGWSLAWKTCLWARLGEGDLAHEALLKQLRLVHPKEGMNLHVGGIYKNLFSAHPPYQIDGNFGIAAGIAEMLLQCRSNQIILLPALPKAWRQGAVKGIKAHRNIEVEIHFEHGVLQTARLQGKSGMLVEVVYGGTSIAVPLDDDGTVTLSKADFIK